MAFTQESVGQTMVYVMGADGGHLVMAHLTSSGVGIATVAAL